MHLRIYLYCFSTPASMPLDAPGAPGRICVYRLGINQDGGLRGFSTQRHNIAGGLSVARPERSVDVFHVSGRFYPISDLAPSDNRAVKQVACFGLTHRNASLSSSHDDCALREDHVFDA